MRNIPAFLIVGLLAGCTVSADLRDADTLRIVAAESASAAENWLIENVRDDGLFHYLYDPTNNTYTLENNVIRQMMASRVLAEISQEKAELQDLHRSNLEAAMRAWYREENGIAFFQAGGQAKLGNNAMALRTLVASPFFEEYRREADLLMKGILSVENPSGAFRAWIREPETITDDPDYLLTFYSGEAILALLEYGEKAGSAEALRAAEMAQNYYIKRYVDELDEHYYPAYVPWHTMALRKFYEHTGDERYADAVITLNDKLLELLDVSRYPGRFYNPRTPQYGTPHASSDAVYTEGLVHAYAVAEKMGNANRMFHYRQALSLAVSNLRQLQYTPEEAATYSVDPNNLVGALAIAENRPSIRVDTTQHALDAFRAIEEVFQ